MSTNETRVKNSGSGAPAPLRNIAALETLMLQLRERPEHLPGLGTFSGPSGYGKSTAAGYVSSKHQAYYVEVRSSWTKKAFLETLLQQMGIVPKKTAYQMADQAAEELAVTQYPLILDEFDNAVERNLIELVRDLYEQSKAPIILIGEERLPQKLQQCERFHGRILHWAQAVPADMDDARILARHYTPEVKVEDDLLARVVDAAHGSVRRVVANLETIRGVARNEGIKAINAEQWGKRQLMTGKPPAPRKF